LEIKISLNQIKNTEESHSSKLEQVKDRISVLKDKIDIKEKNRRPLRHRTQNLQKEYARTQQFHQKTKPENHGHQRKKAKGLCNIFNKIIAENFQNLEKELSIQVQKASRTPNRFDQNRTYPWHIIVKTASTKDRERILKAVREKKQHMKVNHSKT
jgi:hypothetical protein